MSDPRPLTEQERDELVAFLDGELPEPAAQEFEGRLGRDPRLRAEAESLKTTWDLLDFLPKPEPSPSFAERTLSRIEPAVTAERVAAPALPWKRVGLGVGWAAAALVSMWLGYRAYGWFSPRGPGDAELLRDLRVIENKRFYELIEDVRYLDQLDQPDLFGDETGG